MSINREQPIACFQRSLHAGAIVVAALVAVSPIAAGLLVFLGTLLLGLLCYAPTVIAVAGMVVGVIAALVGLFAGLVGCIPGLIILLLFYLLFRASASAQEAGRACVDFGAHSMSWCWHSAFLGAKFWAWPWLLEVAALAAAASALASIHLLRAWNRGWGPSGRRRRECVWCGSQGAASHRCTSCGADVVGLEPGPFGILNARCGGCGFSLPTVDHWGRRDLVKVCSACAQPGVSAGFDRFDRVRIGLMGAASSGKTSLLIAAIRQLEALAREHGAAVLFNDRSDELWYQAATAMMERGEPPVKTAADEVPTAAAIAVRGPKDLNTLLCLHDIAGEASIDPSALSRHQHHRAVDGLIFALDPFAQPQLTPALGRPPEGCAPSDVGAEEVLTAMTSRLEALLGAASTDRLPVSLAVVLTKGDAGVFAALGIPVHRSLAPGSAAEESARIREFLRASGMSNFVNLVEARYARSAWFVSSALGRTPRPGDDSPLRPIRTFDPFDWILSESPGASLAEALRTRPAARTEQDLRSGPDDAPREAPEPASGGAGA